MAYRIGSVVELQTSFHPGNKDEQRVYDKEAQGEITDIHELEEERYFVTFEDYTDDEDVTIAFWVDEEDLYVL